MEIFLQDTFSVHGEAARFVAQEYFRTLAAVTNIGTTLAVGGYVYDDD